MIPWSCMHMKPGNGDTVHIAGNVREKLLDLLFSQPKPKTNHQACANSDNFIKWVALCTYLRTVRMHVHAQVYEYKSTRVKYK